MQQLPAERLVIANGAVAAMERAIQLTLDYTRERETFGNAIFDYQNTQFKLAECKADWMAARAMVDQLTQQLMDGKLDANTAAAAYRQSLNRPSYLSLIRQCRPWLNRQ